MSPFFDYATCEPLRIFSRLEPRARRVDFDEALQARVHDPLWMLGRQWQMGEFKGEDTGSAVLAKLARRLTKVTEVAVGGGAFEPEDLSLPAEARVERLAIDFPVIARARLGRRFLMVLDDEAAANPPTGTPYDGATYRALLRHVYPIDAPPAAAAGDPVAIARARVDGRARRTAGTLAGHAVDGVALHGVLHAGMTVADLDPELATGIVPGHETIVLAALERYRVWFDDLYPPPPPPNRSGWNGAQLEYQAACHLPRDGGTLTLTVDQHVTGRLDWSAFDQGTIDPAGTSASDTDVRTVIPAPAEFAGMPNPRWWQLEDAAVDLGAFHAQATDLAKIVVAEFALVYGNNWFVVPYVQPIGTLAEIEGVLITDVFGHRTLVEAATPSSGGNWTSWDMFSLSPRGTTTASGPLPEHLFLPAGLGTVLDAPPHETVALVRDESADMVWGVEQRIPDGLGAAQDGTQVARRFTDELATQWPEPPPPPARVPGAPPPPNPPLRYVLGTEVPESWIPFLAVHKPADTRQIRLQRAAMPRFVPPTKDPDHPAETQPVRPRTSILREGVSDDDLTATAYFVEEEEVPRAGINVNGALRRVRWLGGRTLVWHGRTVASGRGETDSGLRFDTVKPEDPRP